MPHGYAVVLQDIRDRHRSEGTKEYFHSATPHTGRDGYDTIEWIAAQPWSNGRTGMVGSSYAAITQIRTALEAPPHLTAIWPDVVPTNVYHHQTREGGAMQMHMFWALYIHAADAQEVQGHPDKQEDVWDDLRNLRRLFWEWPWHKGELALRHVPALDETLEHYVSRGAYDEWWAKKENDFTRFWHDHGDIPATMTTGWYDGFPHSDTEYFAAMAEKNTAPQRLIVGPWSHVGMRGDVTWTLDVDFGPDSRWGVAAVLRGAVALLRPRYLKDATGRRSDDAPVRIFVMGGGTGRKTGEGKLDHGGRWRDEQEWPLARAHADDVAPARRRLADGDETVSESRGVHVRPGRPRADDRRQLLRRRRVPGAGRGHGADVDAPAQPGAAPAEHHDARAPPTRRSPRPSSPRGSRTSGSRSGPTCSSTRPSRSPSRSR